MKSRLTVLCCSRNLRRQSSESHANSFILREMIPPYRSASSEAGKSAEHSWYDTGFANMSSGTGKAARQRGIVGGHIRGGTLFPNMAIRLSAEMDKLTKQTGKNLKALVSEVMHKLEKDMDLALAGQDDDGEQSARRLSASQLDQIKTFERRLEALKVRAEAL